MILEISNFTVTIQRKKGCPSKTTYSFLKFSIYKVVAYSVTSVIKFSTSESSCSTLAKSNSFSNKATAP
jgi:hypothetical protein